MIVGGREASVCSGGGGVRRLYFSCFSISDTADITSRVFYIFSNRGVESSRIVRIVRSIRRSGRHSSIVLCSDLNYVFREGIVVNIVSISVTTEQNVIMDEK